MTVGVLTNCHTQYTSDSSICLFSFNRTILQFFVTYLTGMCTVRNSTNINTIIEFVPHVSGGFNGGSDSYLQFRDTHAPCLLKLCIPPSNGIVRWQMFPEFGVELPLGNCTPTVILNNPVCTVKTCIKCLICQYYKENTDIIFRHDEANL